MTQVIAVLQRIREPIFNVAVDVVEWSNAIDRIFEWADQRRSRTVCACNVHSLITARRLAAHAEAIRAADLVTPDGSPVAWLLRRRGYSRQARIGGPDLMWVCCERAARLGTEMFLYGSTPEVLDQLRQRLLAEFPGIKIVGMFSPPFHELSSAEDAQVVEAINRCGARIVWVGLGCPKQEAWLKAHRGVVNAVMLGVGAAFDFHAGTLKRAPGWARRIGLEWLHRLLQEPRRLALRYLVTNSIFVCAAIPEILNGKKGRLQVTQRYRPTVGHRMRVRLPSNRSTNGS